MTNSDFPASRVGKCGGTNDSLQEKTAIAFHERIHLLFLVWGKNPSIQYRGGWLEGLLTRTVSAFVAIYCNHVGG